MRSRIADQFRDLVEDYKLENAVTKPGALSGCSFRHPQTTPR